MRLKDLQERRANLVNEMRSLADNPKGQGGDLSEDQAQRFEELRAENEKLEKQIERQQAIDEAERRMGGNPVGGSDTYEAELANFSVRKAMAGAAGLDVDWGREREIGQEYAKRAGLTPQGVVIPLRAGETRATTLSDVPNLHPTENLTGSFIEKLRSRTVVRGLGARMLSDLRGDVQIPGMGDSVSATWFGEDEEIPLSSMGDRQITMSPKHVGSRAELSRNVLLQSSPDVEQLIQTDMAAVLARAVDKAALQGSGSDSEPEGILTKSISEVDMSTDGPSWELIQELIGKLEDEDAEGSAFVCRPDVVRKLRTTNKVSDEPEHGFLMDSRNSLDGYPVSRTTHVEADRLLFGRFSDVLIGQWGGVEVLANPYASGSYEKGNIQYRIIQTMDVEIRHPESFAVGKL